MHISDARTESSNKVNQQSHRAPARGTRLSSDWLPSDADRQFAIENGLKPDTVVDAFRDYWIAVSGNNAVKCDWSATAELVQT